MPKIFALGDTHLGFGVGKTMDRFGAEWIEHPRTIRERTVATVGADDILLIPGDLSWATKRHQAEPDLAYLADLPGVKIAIKGNHDYWWESDKPIGYPGLLSPPVVVSGQWSVDSGERARVATGGQVALPTIHYPLTTHPTTAHYPLPTDSIGFAGTRGWNLPQPDVETYAADKKTFERERRRLQKSLDAIAHCRVNIALLHYPPQPFLDILSGAGVSICVYGHVHVNSLPDDEKLAVFGETLSGVTCYCVACDRIDFTPVEVFSF